MKIRSATLFQGDDIDNFKRSIEKLNLIREEQEIYTVRAAVKDREDTVLQNFCRQNTWGYSFSYDIEEIDEELSVLIGDHLDDEKCFVNFDSCIWVSVEIWTKHC